MHTTPARTPRRLLASVLLALALLTTSASAAAPAYAGTLTGAARAPVTLVHVQANIDNTIPARRIREDVRTVFRQGASTIVFNEATRPAHEAIRRQARARGYAVLVPRGAASEVVLAWRRADLRRTGSSTTFVSDGISGVQPNRYVVAVDLVHRRTGQRVTVAGTHTIAYGWTTHRDEAWRRAKWFRHVHRMARVLHAAYQLSDVVVWSGDMNRPRATFPGRLFPQFAFTGAATARVARTDATQYGPATRWQHLVVDYTGAISHRHHVRVVGTSTPALHSDHDLVRAVYRWTP